MNKEGASTDMSINVQNAITANTPSTTTPPARPKRKYTKKVKPDQEDTTSKKTKTRSSTKPRPPRVPVIRAEGSCQVCCESFNVTSNALIVCPRCPYKACKSCHQRYLLSSISAPHCMNCRNRWTYKNLLTLFQQSFVTKTFRKQRGQYLLDRAKSHLPLAMPYVAVENDLKALDQEVRQLSKEFKVLRHEVRYNMMPNLTPKEREKRYQRYNEVATLLYTKSQERRVLWNRSYKARNRRNVETYTSFEEPCPVDDCRGFIEKCGQRCGICKTFVCRKCTKVLGKIKEDPKLVKPIVTTDAVNDDEMDDVMKQIQDMEKREQIEKELNDYDEKDENNFEAMEAYGDEEKEEAIFNEQQEDDRKEDPTITNADHGEDDEKLLSASNLSNEEKKELRKLKKAHKCKQEDVDSVKEIRQHSRACPNCKARIFRISGCDTMWCTRCNTGFNWRTGLVIKDARDLHNPHYIDFVRHNPGFQYNHQQGQPTNANEAKNAVLDNPCDRLTIETIQLPDAYSILRRMNSVDASIRTIVLAFQQQMLHVRDYARRKFMAGNQYDETDYALRYVTKRWDEKRWRIQIEHHSRFRETNQEYIDVIMTWLVVMNDLFATHLPPSPPITVDGAKRFIEQMRHISEYTNTTLNEMNTMYKRKTTLIEIHADVKDETLMSNLWNRLKGVFASK